MRNVNNQKNQFYQTKVITLGNSSVGKTSILNRFTWDGKGEYCPKTSPTVGIDFKTKNIKNPKCTLKMQIWDTAGQERFRNLTDSYFKGANGIVLVYSVSDRNSFDEICDWMYQIHAKADEECIIVILGNKCDVGREKRQVERKEGEKLVEKYKVFFMEVSAQQNVGISEAFQLLSQKIIQSIQKNPNKNKHSLILNEEKDKKLKKKAQCCK